MPDPTPLPPQAQAVLDFWFGPPDAAGRLAPREAWFRKDPGFDAEVHARFGELVEQALSGDLTDWEASVDAPPLPLAALALLIVLDQFPRNLFRGRARAFDGDARALALATRLVAGGRDREFAGVQRQFIYLPFEHAETLAAQRCSMALFGQLVHDEPALADLLVWAGRHQAVIERFGRFPHRNDALGRASSAEELAFLAEPGSRF